MWTYTLDTSDDDAYPFISDGQLLLGDDGLVFQRHYQALSTDYASWKKAPKAPLPNREADGFPAEYHSDVDGDRYAIVDAEDFDLTGWSVEVKKDERWYERAGCLP